MSTVGIIVFGICICYAIHKIIYLMDKFIFDDDGQNKIIKNK